MLWAAAVPARAALFGFLGDAGESVKAVDDRVTLDAAALAQGSSRHYRYQDGATKVRFFLVRDRQGVVRAAFDACEACWRNGKGYVMKDGAMFCSNCGRSFALNRIGLVTGGCNPHPLEFAVKENTVSISARQLLNGAPYFPENKK
jgi:uncharacterized membrane protein